MFVCVCAVAAAVFASIIRFFIIYRSPVYTFVAGCQWYAVRKCVYWKTETVSWTVLHFATPMLLLLLLFRAYLGLDAVRCGR